MQVNAFLEHTATRYPEKTALVCEGRRLTYRWIDEECNRLAHGLIAKGVKRGDRVAVYLDNSVEAVLAIFAILKAGAVLVLVNPTIKLEKLSYMLNNSGARVLITKSQKMKTIVSCWEHTPDLETVVVAGYGPDIENPKKRMISWETLIWQHDGSTESPPHRCIDMDVAALIYTSGSTGAPKGVVMSHLNMVAAATSVIDYLANTPDDVILNVLPLSFSYGLYQILMGFKVGATVVLERSFTYPHEVLHRLTEEGATGFAIVPTIASVLLQLDLSQLRFPRLRYITNAGAALPAEHIARLRQLFPQTRLYLMYGLTECKRVSYLPPEELDRRPTSVGKAIPNVEVYIVDEEGRRLPSGEVGELVVRGSNVMRGYWKSSQETDKVLKPGEVPGERVLYTGDLFKMDDEGYLYWIGRRDDIIKSRGEKVSPKEIENVLYKLEGVTMAAVVGVPDLVLGEAVKAVITIKDGANITETDVLRHCARHLEDFMVPKLVEFRAVMPRTAAGKIDKRELIGQKEQ